MRVKRNIGEVSSKYGYDPSAFSRDIERHYQEYEQLYCEFVEWMKTKNVNPKTFNSLYIRYYDDFIK